MIRRLYQLLPGPAPVRALLGLALIAGAAFLLVLFYEWLGDVFLDSGGVIE